MQTVKQPELEDLGIISQNRCTFLAPDLNARLVGIDNPAVSITKSDNGEDVFTLDCSKLPFTRLEGEGQWRHPTLLGERTNFITRDFNGGNVQVKPRTSDDGDVEKVYDIPPKYSYFFQICITQKKKAYHYSTKCIWYICTDHRCKPLETIMDRDPEIEA